MSAAAQESADEADTDTDEGWDIYPQVTQHPHTIIAGSEIVDIVGVTVDEDQEDTGHSVAVVWKDPTIARGTVWQNREVPDNFDSAAAFNAALKTAITEVENYANGAEVTESAQSTARQRVEEALEEDVDWDTATEDPYADDGFYSQHSLAVDYKAADPDDRDFEKQEVSGETLGISVGSDVFASEQVEDFEHDYAMVWYRGISGQFIMRALDFNGRPSARFKDDGYLVKGLLQHPLGWFDRDLEDDSIDVPDEVANSSNRRRTLASPNEIGRPPRVARPTALRPDIEGEEVFIEIDRYDGGNMLSATVAFNDFEDDPDEATEIEPNYYQTDEDQSPEQFLVDEFGLDGEDEIEYLYGLYHGSGWQDEPANAFWGAGEGDSGDGGGSFDVDANVSDEAVEHPTDDEREFAAMVSEQIAGTGADPDEDIFDVGETDTDLEGLVGQNAEQFGVTPDVDAIRQVVYENVSHLDPEDL